MADLTRWTLNRHIAASLLTITAAMAMTPEAKAADETCFKTPTPVMSLGFGSRYEADSKTRSAIDEDSDAAVTKALKPIDQFIQNLAKVVSKAQKEKDVATRRAYQRCVVDSIYSWAKADALNEMRTFNAKLSVPSRVGGLAIVYAEARDQVPGLHDRERIIEKWLQKRAQETVQFFETEATKGAARNNLRAWASMAVGEVGVLNRDRGLVEWSILSNYTMIANAAPDGSLPLEMNRQRHALHYQLHAMTPLVTSIARLCEAGYGKGGADLDKLMTMARFSVAAVKDPGIVQKINGKSQTVKPGLKNNLSSIAWLEPYVSLTNDLEMTKEFSSLRPLSNSKLGGNQTALYEGRRISCTITAQN
ncbi:alginate lyase [Rhizobium sp. WL3]|uniref:alginate lyase family protein n=1 Tax=Rhizobium sp. WL3 TaxID=2603277 RepID=UPI0011C1E2C6|nr:alginate lyase family protein [Rhizobium sp. WL3]MBX9468698.1 alginate lyase family protein [Rhizobium sp.]QEE45103.1 alginate lyase [Rhizobium sp. WL3]